MLKPIPVFASEVEERRFWETHDLTVYVDCSRAQRVRLPNPTASDPTASDVEGSPRSALPERTRTCPTKKRNDSDKMP
jgi:CopG antitoxin of type II toxin-antitoxin system